MVYIVRENCIKISSEKGLFSACVVPEGDMEKLVIVVFDEDDNQKV